MHIMDRTPKVITIIGLVLEGLGSLGLFFGAWIFLGLFSADFFLQLDPDIPMSEINMILDIYEVIGRVMIGLGIVLLIALIINIYLFRGLMIGRYEEKTAKKVYTYQFIWGILNVLSNTITGILYIVSGYQGMNGIKEMKDVREGI